MASAQEGLTEPILEGGIFLRPKKCIDHTGKVFSSQSEMCAYWGISSPTYLSRIESGMTQKEALTKGGRSAVVDFMGTSYPSLEDMCKAYGKSIDIFRYRRQHGWDLKSALTTPISGERTSASTQCKDPEGRIFQSFSALCRAYGKSRALVKYRLSKGLDLAEALKT